jgi:hypothetical protein
VLAVEVGAAVRVTVLLPQTALALEVMEALTAGVLATLMLPVVAVELHPALL